MTLANHFEASTVRIAPAICAQNDKPSEIEAARKRLGLTQQGFATYAGVSLRGYVYFLARRHAPRPSLLKRLEAAARGAPLARPDLKLLAAMHRSTMVLIAAELESDARDVLTRDFTVQRPRDPAYLKAAEIRRIAMYHLVVELGLASAGALSRAIGCTKQNVSLALASIEDLRESDPAIDALFAKLPL